MDVLPAHLNRDSFRDSFKGLVALETILDLPSGFPINNIIFLLVNRSKNVKVWCIKLRPEKSHQKDQADYPRSKKRGAEILSGCNLIWFAFITGNSSLEPLIGVYVLKSMWIWGDVFSAGIEPGTLRMTKFLMCRALNHWAMVTDKSPKIL